MHECTHPYIHTFVYIHACMETYGWIDMDIGEEGGRERLIGMEGWMEGWMHRYRYACRNISVF